MTSMNLKSKPKIILSSTPEETELIGIELARSIRIPGIILLYGDLGAGKTTLTRGIAQGLGLEDTSLVNSPSYSIVNVYSGSCPIYHVDLYRLQGERDIFSIGLDDFLGKEGVTIIEWSERLLTEFPEAIIVELREAGEDKRELRIIAPQKRMRKK
jgi:tRNA threonylcarbamoyladenosine biosynthesis protein TsaE